MDILKIILLFVLICGGLVYLSACIAAFSGHFRSHKKQNNYTPPVSVIIPARNEEKNIGALLEDLLNQDYPPERLEIVVVDDCSDDNTRNIVEGMIANNKRIRLSGTRNSQSPYTHKKRAVHQGILSSSGEIIMTTDADCRIPKSWVSRTVSYFVPEIDLVTGDVIVEGSGFVGWLEALEATGIHAMAAGLMNSRFPITCNGANLAYRRSAFERVNGFEGIGHMVSGDDDLLMQKIAKEKSSCVAFISGKETAVYNNAVKSPGEFFARRARWASKILRYPSAGAIALLTIFFAFFVSVPVWLVLALFGTVGFVPLVAGFVLKVSGDILLTFFGAIKRGQVRLMLIFPVAEVLHIPYIIFVTLHGVFGSFEWRGRRAAAVSPEYRGNIND